MFRVLRLLSRPWRWAWNEFRGLGAELHLSVITYWEGARGARLRYRYYQKCLGALGPGSTIDVGVHFEHPERIFIGSRVHVDRFCHLVAAPPELDLSHRDLSRTNLSETRIEPGVLVIGNDCHLAQYAMIFAHGGVHLADLVTLSAGTRLYSLTSLPESPSDPGRWTSVQPYSGQSPTSIGPVVLGRNVWLGLDVVVFPGVLIGEDSFVRSRSVVTRSCAPNSILAGDPARFRKSRFSKPGRRAH